MAMLFSRNFTGIALGHLREILRSLSVHVTDMWRSWQIGK